MVAGGASGIVGMARRAAAPTTGSLPFMQYLRVLVVVMLTPVLDRGRFLGGPHAQGGAARSRPSA